MHLPAGEIPDEPRVDSTERELARFCPGARTLHVLQYPLHLRSGEVRVEHETRLAPDHAIQLPRLQPVADAGGAAILPHDGVVDRLTGGAIPYDRGLSLIGDTDGSNISRANIRPGERLRRHACLRRPDLGRVMLYPTGLRENLGEFLLRDGDDRAGMIEDDCARARCALIESEDVLHYFQIS